MRRRTALGDGDLSAGNRSDFGERELHNEYGTLALLALDAELAPVGNDDLADIIQTNARAFDAPRDGVVAALERSKIRSWSSAAIPIP
jgi:hypothetical protein